MKRRYVITRTQCYSDICALAMSLYDAGYILDWGYADNYAATGIRWWMEVRE